MESFVPGFTHDVFISYSHLDNRAVDGIGWVSDFVARLHNELGVVLGAEASVWSDDRIGPAHVFARELEDRLRRAAVLIAIISPGYLNSSWCEWELNGFLGAVRTDDLLIDNKSRAIKVVKLPFDTEMHAWSVLPDVKGIDFFRVSADKRPYELVPGSEPFMQAVKSLARDVA